MASHSRQIGDEWCAARLWESAGTWPQQSTSRFGTGTGGIRLCPHRHVVGGCAANLAQPTARPGEISQRLPKVTRTVFVESEGVIVSDWKASHFSCRLELKR